MAAQGFRQQGHHGARFAERPGGEDDGGAAPFGAHVRLRPGSGKASMPQDVGRWMPGRKVSRHGAKELGWVLTIYPGPVAGELPATLPAGAVWLDLLNGTEAEKAFVARTTGLRVPDLESLREIENSSRLMAEGEVLYLSMPIISRGDGPKPQVSALGLVLSPQVLLTVRFAPIGSFDSFAGQFGKAEDTSCSFGAFIGLLEAMVDRIADALERIRGELDDISHAAFEAEVPLRHSPARMDRVLRLSLRSIGRMGEYTSNVRDTLLGDLR
ncbi:MAG: hypothetical protein EON47_13425, partial [Acetobacteraceae bacterium]